MTDTKESPSTLEHALSIIYEDMDQTMGLGPHGRWTLGQGPAKRYVWQAIERGYRLALVAAIEECETYAKGAEEPIRNALMQVAVRIAQRAKEAVRLARPVGAGIPEGFPRASREAPSIEDALAVQQGALFPGMLAVTEVGWYFVEGVRYCSVCRTRRCRRQVGGTLDCAPET